jgi:LPPG:FO 2-phospho-L-lactate transferase
MKVVALAGGVGGAKLADGLAQILSPTDLTIIVNTGDDFEHLGLKICPDLDTVCYTLAGLANPVTGWGCVGETWNALNSLISLGGPDWFRLGDKDIGTHLERTRRLHNGQSLSQITRDFCDAWGIEVAILPMSDDPIPTIVSTDEGELAFQDYFVRKKCQPKVSGFRFERTELSLPPPGVISAIQEAELIVICPSNPWVSIDPILSVPGIKDTFLSKKDVGLEIAAVSPIIGGKAVKGPVVKMYQELGIEPSALSVAQHYGRLLDYFVFDSIDVNLGQDIESLNIHKLCTNTLMRSRDDRKNLAYEILDLIDNSKRYKRKPFDV